MRHGPQLIELSLRDATSVYQLNKKEKKEKKKGMVVERKNTYVGGGGFPKTQPTLIIVVQPLMEKVLS
jgi:hypothetical protein